MTSPFSPLSAPGQAGPRRRSTDCYRADSILDGFSCRGTDAAQIWEMIMVGEWTVGRVASGLRRSVRYAHDLLKHLEAENRLTLGKAKRVTDRSVTVNDLSR